MIKHILDNDGKFAKENEDDILAQAQGLEDDYNEYSEKKAQERKDSKEDLKSREVEIKNREDGHFFGLS